MPGTEPWPPREVSCDWPDSNRHAFTHQHLKLAGLPIPPQSQVSCSVVLLSLLARQLPRHGPWDVCNRRQGAGRPSSQILQKGRRQPSTGTENRTLQGSFVGAATCPEVPARVAREGIEPSLQAYETCSSPRGPRVVAGVGNLTLHAFRPRLMRPGSPTGLVPAVRSAGLEPATAGLGNRCAFRWRLEREWCVCPDSNRDRRLRRPTLYPLRYRHGSDPGRS